MLAGVGGQLGPGHAARAPVVHPEMSGGDWLVRIQDAVDELIAGQLAAQVAGQKHRRLAVPVDESDRHGLSTQTHGKSCV